MNIECHKMECPKNIHCKQYKIYQKYQPDGNICKTCPCFSCIILATCRYLRWEPDIHDYCGNPFNSVMDFYTRCQARMEFDFEMNNYTKKRKKKIKRR